MVEGGSEVISNLSRKNTPFFRGMTIDAIGKTIVKTFGITMWNDFAWFGLRGMKQLNISAESFDLFLCPDDFEIDPIKRMHTLPSQQHQSYKRNRV
jgi:hypothetical protein